MLLLQRTKKGVTIRLPKEKMTSERGTVYTGTARFIAISMVIGIFFTAVIAYGVQSVMAAASGKPSEGEMVNGVRQFALSARQWGYTPSVLMMNPGEKVSFTVTSQDIMHGFAINELGVNLALTPKVGIVRQVEIPPDIPEGTYTMYCSIFCGVGHPFMKGTLLIGEPGFELGKLLPYFATLVMVGMFTTFVVIGRRGAR